MYRPVEGIRQCHSLAALGGVSDANCHNGGSDEAKL
jgi:hypothetical protein